MSDVDDMEELLELYTSEEDVKTAARDKDKSEYEVEDLGSLVKDYPKSQREIDLHGMTGAESMNELDHFINRCIDHRVLTVRVITGKGLHSKNFKSILPEKTESKLAELKREGKVVTFKKEKDGGAFVVYLAS